MKRRELALGLAVLGLVLVAAAWFTVPQRPAGHEEPAGHARVVVGAIVESYGYVIVDVGGVRHVKPFNCFTPDGVGLIASILRYYQPWDDEDEVYGGAQFSIYYSPVVMRVYHDTGYLESTIGKSWGANSSHMWFFISGTFATSEAITLRNVTLYAEVGAFPTGGCGYWVNPNTPCTCMGTYARSYTLSVDELNVQVPAGSVFTVVLAMYWHDQGALTWNWPKVLDVAIPDSLIDYVTVRATDGNLYNYTHFSHAPTIYRGQSVLSVIGRASWVGQQQKGLVSRLFMVCGTGGAGSRDAYSINEVARYDVGVTVTGNGLAVSSTIGTVCSEVGLILKFHPLNPDDPYYQTDQYCNLLDSHIQPQWPERELLLMRWVPSQPVQPGTVVTIYLLPARG
ncbi:MAG: hypothetical protein QXZ31_07190 [Thermofilaceae archaeon]